MTRLRALFVSIFVLVGCGGGTASGVDAGGTTDTGPRSDSGPSTGVAVSGGIIYHSMNRLATEMSGTTPEYSQVTVDLLSQAALLSGSTTPLASVPITTGCMASGMCAFTLPSSDIASATGGLVIGLRDDRATPIWVPSWTGTASGADAAAAAAAGSLTDARAFIVSQEAFDLVLAPMTAVASAELLARGVVFGLVYDEAGRPITGATVAPAGRSDITIVYPNGMFTGTASSTTTQGAFLAVPAAAPSSPEELTFTVTPPSGSTLTWPTTQPALLAPGVLSFTLLYGE
jgi:hypothetical protein